MMLNEQIIIDDVDVSGCEHYCLRYCKQVVDEDGCYVFLCAEDKNCHYKKWQRKEQECEELKIYIESNEQQVNDAEKLVMDNDRLINILQEIKEIALKACECCGECQTEFSIKEYCDFYEILKKIEEAENIQKARKND